MLGGLSREGRFVLKRAVTDAHGRSPDLQGRPGELDLAPVEERAISVLAWSHGKPDGVADASTSCR